MGGMGSRRRGSRFSWGLRNVSILVLGREKKMREWRVGGMLILGRIGRGVVWEAVLAGWDEWDEVVQLCFGVDVGWTSHVFIPNISNPSILRRRILRLCFQAVACF